MGPKMEIPSPHTTSSNSGGGIVEKERLGQDVPHLPQSLLELSQLELLVQEVYARQMLTGGRSKVHVARGLGII